MMEIELINAGKCEVKLSISGNFKKYYLKHSICGIKIKPGYF